MRSSKQINLNPSIWRDILVVTAVTFIVLGAILFLIGDIGTSSPKAGAATMQSLPMLIKSNDLAEIQAAGGVVNPTWVSYGITASPYTGSGLGSPVATYTSYVTLIHDFHDGTLPGPYKWILLDLEPWSATPANEYADLPLYEAKAAYAVHKHGMKIIDSPVVDMFGGNSSKYIKEDVAGSAAQYADAIDLQAQPLDFSTSKYQFFVDRAAAQARKVNPNILVGAGIATDSLGYPISGAQMYRALKSVFPVISWYWLNAAVWGHGAECAPQGCPGAAIAFLHDMEVGHT